MAVPKLIRRVPEAAKSFVPDELRYCRSELGRMGIAAPTTPLWAAVIWSVAAVVWGNGIVMAGRRYGHDQWVTLIAVPVFGGAGCLWLRRRGSSWATLGLRSPEAHGPLVLTGLTLMAAVIAEGVALAGLTTFGYEARGLRTIRTIVGTAFGEELVHRGVLLALWASSGVRTWVVLVMNMVVFGFWHVVGATCDGFHPWQVFWPSLAAVLFVWLRLRFHSLFAPMAVHALNVFGVFKAPGSCPYPWG